MTYSRESELQQAAWLRALSLLLYAFGITLTEYDPCELDELAIRKGR